MTRKQAECLAFIARFLEAGGTPPTVGEIADALNLSSKSGVVRLLDRLEEQGLIRREKYRARSIQLIDPGEVKLNAEIFKLVQDYAKRESVGIDTAANELLRGCFLEASR